MADPLTLKIVSTDDALSEALALARRPVWLPGLDMIVVPAGLDADQVNAALMDTGTLPPPAGTPVAAVSDVPELDLAAGTLGMVQEAEAGTEGPTVLVGEHAVPFDARRFAPAHATTYLRLQHYRARLRHVVAVSGPSADLRYISVAAHAATAAITLLGTPDQIYRMVGPRDSAGVPVSAEFRRVLSAAGHASVRVVGVDGTVVSDLPLSDRRTDWP
ncbi:hypothetical protein [Caenispirillum salinarum]|uniref:hypothetical protein n=1 Tax=Caenispirillum salinarum TaxID=859058 RepID=UPI003850556D